MIRLENVSKYYHSANSVTQALRKINLTFERGEFVAITGESGSGKTTLLNIISGQDSYEEGEIYINGEQTSFFDVKDWEEYRKNHIGFIFQDYNLIDSYNVLDNVLAALYIQNYDQKTALSKALDLIEKVGLTDRLKQRAAKLSGGQKQRLAIARALAKDSDIIVADEPTGNLDSANGNEIIALLKDLSKSKLVIIVTHNYDQVEPYITRKITMFDGEVREDNKVAKTSSNEPSEAISYKKQSYDFIFAMKNIIRQPKKSCLIFLFILLVTLSSFVFMGSFLGNLDESSSKIYNNGAFANANKTRVVVSRKDSNSLDTSDYENISKMNYASSVEKYDLSCDINYFYQKGDYTVKYYKPVMDDDPTKLGRELILKNFQRFVRSYSQDFVLTSGRMPYKQSEIVIADEKFKVGDKISVYFNNSKLWNESEYIQKTFDVVGTTTNSYEQIYFYDEFVNNLQYSFYTNTAVLTLKYRPIGSMMESRQIIDGFILLNENLPPQTVAISDNFAIDNQLKDVTFLKNSMFNVKCSYDGNDLESLTRENLNVSKSIYNTSSKRVIEVSQDIFYKTRFLTKHRQYSIFIDDYAHLSQFLTTLDKEGYLGLSPFRVGSLEYDDDLVKERLITLGISILALIVIYILEISVIKSLLKFKKNDFIIFKMIGMSDLEIKKINYIELFAYSLTAVIITFLIVFILSLLNISFVNGLLKYYTFLNFLVFFLVNSSCALLIAHGFNKYLSKKVKIIALKEERYD